MVGRGKSAQRATCEGVASERSEDAKPQVPARTTDETEPVKRVTEQQQ